MSDPAYWSDRVRELGHTGWDDPIIYRYDQRVRLRAVAEVIATLSLRPGARCLDFGCGVGDFAALLSRKGYRVWGYDIAGPVLRRAAALNAAPNVVYTSRLDDALLEPLDLILSITVLQHVVVDTAFQEVVSLFAQALHPHGRVLVMESFAPSESTTEYLRLRTFDGFVRAFEAAGLQLETSRSFYHPIERPTRQFTRYRRDRMLRLLMRLNGKLPGVGKLLDVIAMLYGARERDYFVPGASPTRVLVFRLKQAN